MDPRWDALARTLDWERPYDRLHEPGSVRDRWFVGGRLNLATNALDRHLDARAGQPALHWEGEPGERRTLTYQALHGEVTALADALTSLGVGPGDRVGLHLGLLPEAVAAMLACARIGAVFSVLPAVLPVEALAARLDDLAPSLLVTQDAAWRHGVLLPLKARADEALAAAGTVEHTVVLRRTGVDVPWFEGDRWYHELLAGPRPGAAAGARTAPASLPAEQPLLVTYLANRRGRPTGIVHGTAGIAAYSLAMHRGLCPDGDEVLWSPAELAWLACQTHGILGPLLAGGTAVIYEGMLDTPTHGRAWEIIERYGVNVLLATPSVVRAVHRWVDQPPDPEQVASLRLVVTAGEPLDDETAQWLRDEVGRGRVPVANAWGQTELGGLVAADVADLRTRLPDAGLRVVDGVGAEVPVGEVGDLVVTAPWPGRAVGVLGGDPDDVPGWDPHRPDVMVTGDLARQRGDGVEYLGRVDRVFSVSGQLVSATEVRDVLAEHPYVARADVVDRPDPRTGRAVVACVQLAGGAVPTEDLATELRLHVHETLGGLSQPQTVAFVPELPADTDAMTLRRALEALTVHASRVVTVTREQLAAALKAAEG